MRITLIHMIVALGLIIQGHWFVPSISFVQRKNHNPMPILTLGGYDAIKHINVCTWESKEIWVNLVVSKLHSFSVFLKTWLTWLTPQDKLTKIETKRWKLSQRTCLSHCFTFLKDWLVFLVFASFTIFQRILMKMFRKMFSTDQFFLGDGLC